MKPATLLSLALLTVGASANVFTTDPVGNTVWKGDELVTIEWKDDNVAPLINTLNNLTIELMTGSTTNQTILDVVATKVNGVTGKATYKVPKTLPPGPGKLYFLRYNQDSANFSWSTIFEIQNIIGSPAAPTVSETPNATPSPPTYPQATPSKTDAPKTDLPKANAADAPKSSAPTASPPIVTPTPQSASEAIGLSPSSLMSIAIGGTAFIFTYMY